MHAEDFNAVALDVLNYSLEAVLEFRQAIGRHDPRYPPFIRIPPGHMVTVPDQSIYERRAIGRLGPNDVMVYMGKDRPLRIEAGDRILYDSEVREIPYIWIAAHRSLHP